MGLLQSHHPPEKVFAIEDLTRSRQFEKHPAVVGSRDFVLIVGAPVLDSGGFSLGSLCVMDYTR